MLGILPKVDEASAADLSRAANAVSAVCKRDLDGVVLSQARGFISKAKKRTPLAPKSVLRSFVEIEHNGMMIWIPTKKPYRFRIKGRGYAKSGWAKAGRALRIMGKDWVSGKGEGIDAGHFKDSIKPAERYIEVGNKIDYIETLDNEAKIVAYAMTGAYIAARRIIDRTVKRDIERAWRTGIAIARAN